MLSSLKQSLGQTLGRGNTDASGDLKKLRDGLLSLEEMVRDLVRDMKGLRDQQGDVASLRAEVASLRAEVAALRRQGGPGGARSGGGGEAAVESEAPAAKAKAEAEAAPEASPEVALPEQKLSPAVLEEVVAILAPEPVHAAPVHVAPAPVQAEASLDSAMQKALSGGRMVHADMGSTDLEAYIARAKAAGRAADTVRGGIGLNIAPDGVAFWGPVDNESSRAKAAQHVLTIDQFECIACGTCVEQTDKVFYLPNGDKATPIAQDGPMDLIQDAIDECPVTCISWVSAEDAASRGLATGAEFA